MSKFTLAVILGGFFLGLGDVEASLVISFANGDQLEGDTVGSQATYADSMTTVVGMLTSRAFTDTIGNLDNAAVLNPNSGTLGVNSSGSNTAASFDNNESWTFDWDVQSSFLGIDVGSFTTAQNERFSVSSTDWIGLSGVMPGTPGSVNFNSATGTFTLINNGSGDVFDLTALTGGSVDLDVSAGTDITIAYANDANTQTAVLQGLTFSLPATAVPEPSSLAALIAIGLLGLVRLRRAAQAIESSVTSDQ